MLALMRQSLFLFCLLVALSVPMLSAQADAEKFYVPPTQFNAAFQIMDMGFSNIFGLFKSATAGFVFDESSKTISHVRLALDASSMITANGGNARDLSALFEPRKYPEITFLALADAAFKDGKAEVKGTLSVHGVSKPFAFEATMNQVGKSSRGADLWREEGQAVGLSLRGSFKRADFGMGDEPEMPGRFGDSVTLLLEMQALRQ